MRVVLAVAMLALSISCAKGNERQKPPPARPVAEDDAEMLAKMKDLADALEAKKGDCPALTKAFDDYAAQHGTAMKLLQNAVIDKVLQMSPEEQKAWRDQREKTQFLDRFGDARQRVELALSPCVTAEERSAKMKTFMK